MTICVKCEKKMKIKNGISDVGRPYIIGNKRYFGDILTCEECGSQVLTNFGMVPQPVIKDN